MPVLARSRLRSRGAMGSARKRSRGKRRLSTILRHLAQTDLDAGKRRIQGGRQALRIPEAVDPRVGIFGIYGIYGIYGIRAPLDPKGGP